MSSAHYFAGVDVGSATTKAVIINDEGMQRGHALDRSGGILKDAASTMLTAALDIAGITRDQVVAIVSTGYGRDRVGERTKSVTEITCHGRGAYTLFPEARSVIDIGGQDSKAIALDSNGKIRKFEMNDKCAAGTGRFLEVMARTLGLELDEFGPMALEADGAATISSTCTVFAESEVVSLLAQEVTVPRILAGLCNAISHRVNGLASRVGMQPEVMMTGGVARNTGVVKTMEMMLGQPLHIPENPQLVGAFGAALIARDLAIHEGML